MKTWLDFGDLDLIFDVTAELNRSISSCVVGGHPFSLKILLVIIFYGTGNIW